MASASALGKLTKRPRATIVSLGKTGGGRRAGFGTLQGKGSVVRDAWDNLVQLVTSLGYLAVDLAQLALQWSLLIVWVAWWLWGVNWRRTWPVLARGAWLPLLLLMIVGALVWSRLAPSDCNCLGFVTVPNFWWQLGAVGLLAALTLFCGWVQGYFGWTPAELDLEPPGQIGHGAHHGHH
jgi:hypothetical protein